MANESWGAKIEGGYFSEALHRYRNEAGTIIPSATQVFELLGMSDFSMVKPEDLEWSRQYGDAVHKAMELNVTGDLDWDSVDDAIMAPVVGIETHLREMEFVLEASEEQRIAVINGMQYGMKLDLRGEITHQAKRRKAVIDLKTGSKFSKTWDWQEGAYLIPQPKVPLGWIGVILQVNPNGEVTPHYVKDVEAAKREFMVLLAAAIVKLNNGFSRMEG